MADPETCRPIEGLGRLAVHTQTTRSWDLERCLDEYGRAGIPGISIWRHTVEPLGIEAAARAVRRSGLAVPALVRGGFFVASDSSARAAAIDDNRRAIAEAAELGAEMLVIVPGARPEVPLGEARRQVHDAIAALLADAADAGVRLAIEPLHPMYAADRSCVVRLGEARAICDALDDPWLGVVVDVYHVWWDGMLAQEIDLLGAQDRIFGFHLCDWRVDTRDVFEDRGLMGEGCIDLPGIRALVERAGFGGWHEVEIFSKAHWARDQREFLADVVRAYREHC